MKYKLYVWKTFKCDYTCGIAFAIAKTKKGARKAIKKQYATELGYNDVSQCDYIDKDLDYEPEVHDLDEVYAYSVSGSG